MTKLEIDTDYLAAQLKALLAIDSPTGFTDTIVRHCTRELERLGMSVELTRRGAIRAVRQGSRRSGARAIITHLDTLGAQVKMVKDNGRLELVPIGHWSSRFAEGARANIYSYDATHRGSILPLKASGHTFNEGVDEQPVDWRQVELRIDARTGSKEETMALGIDIGDIVAIDPETEFMDNGFIVSRHLDDKAGVAASLAALEAMEREKVRTPVDIHWLFSIAEEVGVGATAIVSPEVASMVAIDNGTSAPGQNSSEFGVTIAMADQTGPFDYHAARHLPLLPLRFRLGGGGRPRRTHGAGRLRRRCLARLRAHPHPRAEVDRGTRHRLCDEPRRDQARSGGDFHHEGFHQAALRLARRRVRRAPVPRPCLRACATPAA